MQEEADILLVDDSESDIVLVKEALKDASVYNFLHVVKDGEQAKQFLLRNKDLNPDGVVPGLILLDLTLPKIHGLEILKFIKTDDKLKSIPTVIMSSSEAETDIAKSYELQANSYITKPVDYEQMIRVVKSIEEFWLKVVRLPNVDGV